MKPKTMQKTISGMMIVASFVFLMAIVGGVQKDTIDVMSAFVYIFGSFVIFIIGFFFLVGGTCKK